MTEAGIRVTIDEADAELCDSVASLARVFGSTVLEPSWWPEDVGPIEYRLDRFPNHVQYTIRALRQADGGLICVIGHAHDPSDGRSAGHWYAPAELKDLGALIGTVGRPPRLQAVVHDGALALHLFGYESEAEIVRAAKSLRRVTADQ